MDADLDRPALHRVDETRISRLLSSRDKAYRNAPTSETQRHAWSVLHVLWQDRKREGDLDAADISAIDAIFSSRSSDGGQFGWERLNDAELRVASLLTPSQIKSHFSILLSAAVRRRIPDLAEFQRQAVIFSNDDNYPEQRAVYMALLFSLQRDFIEKRVLRNIRVSIAGRMFRYGILAALFPVAILVLFAGYLKTVQVLDIGEIHKYYVETGSLYLVLVAALGMLGAYFSRMIDFQTTIASLTFENAANEYVDRVIRLRMLYGMIGAFIFFLVLRSEIFTAAILPQFGEKDLPFQWSNLGPFMMLLPSSNLAKLMIYAFLAGFSERLVPDTLARIDQRTAFPER
jgi:hypothetical protein